MVVAVFLPSSCLLYCGFTARCSIVDTELNTVLDIYVRPERPVADYRTRYSGIRKCHMKNAVPTDMARQRIIDLIKVVLSMVICRESPDPYRMDNRNLS